jgi:CDGSH-type Zn-finger protein
MQVLDTILQRFPLPSQPGKKMLRDFKFQIKERHQVEHNSASQTAFQICFCGTSQTKPIDYELYFL